jgi:hypothetical protein
MYKTNIMDLSFIRWTDIKPFFISPDQEDLNLANNILERHEVYADKLEELIEELNLTYGDWHFYLKDCRITRTRAQYKRISMTGINDS